MKHLIFFIVFSAAITWRTGAQSLPSEPLRTLTAGHQGLDKFYGMASTAAGTLAMVGVAGRGDFGGSDALFMVTTQHLEKNIERRIGRSKDDGAYAVAALPAGGWLVAGFSTNPGNGARHRATYLGGQDAWLLQLDAKGQTKKEWIMGGAGHDEWRCVFPLLNGKTLLAGNYGDFAWVVCADTSGNTLWELRQQHFHLPTRICNATLSANNTLFLTGFVEEQGQRRLWVAAVNAQGQMLWEKMWPNALAIEGWGIDATENALYIGGYAKDTHGRDNGFVTKLNFNGTVLHHTVLGGSENDRVHTLKIIGNQHLLLAGNSKSFQRGSRRDQAWVLRCDTSCRVLDEQYYGGKNDNALYALVDGPGGRLYAAGFSNSLISKGNQAWAIQLREGKPIKPNNAVTVAPQPIQQTETTPKPVQGVTALWLDPNPDLYDRQELVWPDPTISISVKVLSTVEVGKQDFCLEINGQPCIDGVKFDEVAMRGGSVNSRTFEQSITLREGLNILRARVQNSAGMAETEPLKIIYSPRKPNLHLLAVGVPSPDLKYTDKDARDFATALNRNNMAFNAIFTDTLFTEAATTKTEVLKSLRRLQYRYKERQIAPNDVVVVFFSSHGLNTSEKDFRIAAGDFDGPFLDETSLDFDSELIDYLEQVVCQKLIIVDACLSGSADNNNAGTGPVLNASAHPSLNLFMSCRANELSYEDAQWENGAFTEAIIEAFDLFTRNPLQIDANQDLQLSIVELYAFVQQRVPELVQSKRPKTPTNQTPLLLPAANKDPLVLFKRRP